MDYGNDFGRQEEDLQPRQYSNTDIRIAQSAGGRKPWDA